MALLTLQIDYLDADPAVLPGISDHVFVSLGYSSLAILVCLILFILILFIPFGSFMRLQKNMVVCGNNSFAISAACHASTWNTHKGQLASSDSLEMLPLTPCSPYSAQGMADLSMTVAGSPTLSEPLPTGSLRRATNTTATPYSNCPQNEDMEETELLRQISQSPVRWGVVQMSPEWAARFSETGQQVEHLTFGTAAQNVEDPTVGKFYT
jgi:hypothetical protein